MTTSEYYDQLPEPTRAKMLELRDVILDVAPTATESIGYGMPAFSLAGKKFAFIGGFKHHVSLFPHGNAMIEKYAAELTPYKTTKGTIQFPLDQPLPESLIKAIVADRILQLDV